MHELQALLREYDRARAYTDELWKDLTDVPRARAARYSG
jgi:hypothetical protein